jgi:hypothetical protein
MATDLTEAVARMEWLIDTGVLSATWRVDLRTILAALPTPEERDSMDVAAQVMLATDYFDADSKRLRNYLNRTRTGGATDGE